MGSARRHDDREERAARLPRVMLAREPEQAAGIAGVLPWLLTLLLALLSPFVYDLARWLLSAVRAV